MNKWETGIAFAVIMAAVLFVTGCAKSNGAAKTSGNDSGAASTEAAKVRVEVPQKEAEDNHRVFYQIFVGSFSDSNGDGIGDLRGIINRLDYLNDGDLGSEKSLGVTGIWLSPIFESPSYHKYDTTDYYHIDPSFGTMEDLKELADLCEERGIKLILDVAFNHTGSKNEWFKSFCEAHVKGDTDSEFYNLYSFSKEAKVGGRKFYPIKGSEDFYEGNFSSDMPELNYDDELARSLVLDVAKYYIEEIGIDGFRFDAAKYIYYGYNETSADFWTWFMGELRAIKPDIFAVAEVWDTDNTVMNYEKAFDCFNFTLAQYDGRLASTVRNGSVTSYVRYIDEYLDRIAEQNPDAQLMSFIVNHDMDRCAGYLNPSNGTAQMGANLLLLNPGSCFIYYGEEIGMKGTRGSDNTDANRRLAMLWGDGDTVADPEGATYFSSNQVNGTVAEQVESEESLLNYYKHLIYVRNANPEIASGDFTALSFEGTKAGGFVSVLGDSTVGVFHNTTEEQVVLDLSKATDYTFSTVVESLGAGEGSLQGTELRLDGRTSVILR